MKTISKQPPTEPTNQRTNEPTNQPSDNDITKKLTTYNLHVTNYLQATNYLVKTYKPTSRSSTASMEAHLLGPGLWSNLRSMCAGRSHGCLGPKKTKKPIDSRKNRPKPVGCRGFLFDPKPSLSSFSLKGLSI